MHHYGNYKSINQIFVPGNQELTGVSDIRHRMIFNKQVPVVITITDMQLL